MKEYKQRVYVCRDCGNEITTGTNHTMDIYPNCTGKCKQFIRTGSGSTEQEIVLPKQTSHRYIKDSV